MQPGKTLYFLVNFCSPTLCCVGLQLRFSAFLPGTSSCTLWAYLSTWSQKMQELLSLINFLFWIPFAWAQEVLECWGFKTFFIFLWGGRWTMGMAQLSLSFIETWGLPGWWNPVPELAGRPRGRSCWGNTACTNLQLLQNKENGTRRLGTVLGLPCRAQLPFWVLGRCVLPCLPAWQSLFRPSLHQQGRGDPILTIKPGLRLTALTCLIGK